MSREDGVLLADGFESAFVGIGTQFNRQIAIYDYDLCIATLVDRDGMDPDEAVEFFEFNVAGAYVGPATPIYLRPWGKGDIDVARLVIAEMEGET